MWFTIDRYDHGCCGSRYASKLQAIKDNAWQVWTEERVRRMHNFGNGTMEDHFRYCKRNNCDPITEEDFWRIAEPLGNQWKEEAENFINSSLTHLYE